MCFTHKGPVVLVVGPVLQIAMDTGLHQLGCSCLGTTSKFLSRDEGWTLYFSTSSLLLNISFLSLLPTYHLLFTYLMHPHLQGGKCNSGTRFGWNHQKYIPFFLFVSFLSSVCEVLYTALMLSQASVWWNSSLFQKPKVELSCSHRPI